MSVVGTRTGCIFRGIVVAPVLLNAPCVLTVGYHMCFDTRPTWFSLMMSLLMRRMPALVLRHFLSEHCTRESPRASIHPSVTATNSIVDVMLTRTQHFKQAAQTDCLLWHPYRSYLDLLDCVDIFLLFEIQA